MTVQDIIHTITLFVKEHEIWAVPIVFLLAFGESLAFISLLIPATVILLGLGALIGESGLLFWPIWLAAALGAFFGDWISYWVGYHYKEGVRNLWPISRSPQTLVRGHQFFNRWGVWGYLLGDFWAFSGNSAFSCGDLCYATTLFSAGEFGFCDDLGIWYSGSRGVWPAMAGEMDRIIASFIANQRMM